MSRLTDPLEGGKVTGMAGKGSSRGSWRRKSASTPSTREIETPQLRKTLSIR